MFFRGGGVAHGLCLVLLDRVFVAWVRSSPTDKMTAVSPPPRRPLVLLLYTLTGDLAKEVQPRL